MNIIFQIEPRVNYASTPNRKHHKYIHTYHIHIHTYIHIATTIQAIACKLVYLYGIHIRTTCISLTRQGRIQDFGNGVGGGGG